MALTITQRISLARKNLIGNGAHMFFGALALRLKLVDVKECKHPLAGQVDTAATDGRCIYFNPDFFAGMSDDELKTVLAHEVMHVANMHMTRMGARDRLLWNIATDARINADLVECGFKMPSKGGVLIDKYKDRTKWSSEAIYEDLKANAKIIKVYLGKDGKGDGKLDPGGMGGMLEPVDGDGQPLSPQEIDALEKSIAGDVKASIKQAKQMGTMPGSLEHDFPDAREPKVDWRQVLQAFMQNNLGSPHDTTWARPNRRFIASGMYLPSVLHENPAEVVIAVDTSGSIGEAELATFAGEINAIKNALSPTWIHVLYCDTQVNHYDKFGKMDTLMLKRYGGGGTDFRPPFKYVKKHNIKPKCLIYFSDLYGTFPDAPPSYNVLWACTTPQTQAPFGETLHVEVE